MAVLTLLFSIYALPLGVLLLLLVPYFTKRHWRDIPGPISATFSNLWLMYYCRLGRRSLAVHDAHKKYGPLVRIQPNHVSIADDKAIPIVYGHGNGFLKSDYYDAFVSIRRGLFNTRDRDEHTRKRKTISHTFSAKSVGQFEQYVHSNIELFVSQWCKICDTETNPRTGYASIDALQWFNYLAFDTIGDLAFGAPFGMLEAGRDVAEVTRAPGLPATYAPAIEVLNRRGEVCSTLGVYPQLIRYAKYIPDRFFKEGLEAVKDLAGIAISRVSDRLQRQVEDRVDLLARLMEGKDETGAKLGRDELTAEALTQLIAGSDTTSNTYCAILYLALTNPGVIEKLQKCLDEALPPGVMVPVYAQLKDIPYIQWVIYEAMRVHSTSGVGLPRQIPANSPPLTIAGHVFKAGDIVSVPAYTMHHSQDVWGSDAEDFVPERWAPSRLTSRQKAAFIPFSTGPRGCVGRNLAEMELTCVVATVFKNFEFRMEQDGPMEVSEGFLRKPLFLRVGMKRREIKA